MSKNILDKIKIVRLKIIKSSEGSVMHILKKKQLKNWTFGEAYFSKIKFGKVKPWRCHLKMTLNLAVPYGKVKFVFYSPRNNFFKVINIGEKKYSRLTIPPNIWFAFKGVGRPESMIINLANIQHNPKEILRLKKNDIKFNW